MPFDIFSISAFVACLSFTSAIFIALAAGLDRKILLFDVVSIAFLLTLGVITAYCCILASLPYPYEIVETIGA
jgi:hypothetical protein